MLDTQGKKIIVNTTACMTFFKDSKCIVSYVILYGPVFDNVKKSFYH